MGNEALTPAPWQTADLALWLRQRVAEMLGIEAARVDEDASFFALGLDSSQLTELAAMLEDRTGRRVPSALPFDHPTIASLCRHLTAERSASGAHPTHEWLGAPEASIAVVAIGCRLPGGLDSPEALWTALAEGRDLVGPMPSSRARLDAIPGADEARPVGSYFASPDLFDSDFFGVSPHEAQFVDPQHRILLEVTHEAIERAGIRPGALRGRKIGVFMGVGAPEYARRHLWSGDEQRIGLYSATGSAPSAGVGRISFSLGLRGPCMAVDTACSSSASAVHLACASLRTGESEVALAGGVNAILSWEAGHAMHLIGALSASGRCRSFDQAADGYVRGEGCAVFVLKRLRDALRDGDEIWAVIEGSAMNQDGLSAGLTAPNGEAQVELIRSALARAGVTPADVSLLETHGTGTRLGDAIELRALHQVFKQTKPVIGSIKANLGHLESAAGAIGLLKAILCLRHRTAVPQLHVSVPNAEISDEVGALVLPRGLLPLPPAAVAGVSSFGFSGTNVHLVVREAPVAPAPPPERDTDPAARPPWIVPVSGRDSLAPARQAQHIAGWLAGVDERELAALQATQAHRRDHHPYRALAIGRDRRELIASLRSIQQPVARCESRCSTVFVFSGQGGHWAGMGRGLHRESAAFREGWDDAVAALAEFAPWVAEHSLAILDDPSRLDDVETVQPLIFAHQVASTRMWRSLGAQPAAVVGHSMGEAAAAWCAGQLALRDAARVICRRSQALRATAHSGAMALVSLAHAELADRFPLAELELAATNSPSSCVVTGPRAAVESLVARLERAGVQARLIRVGVASHSSAVEPCLEALAGSLSELEPLEGDRPMLSTVDLEWCRGRRLDADYWVRNLRRPVRFGEAILELARRGAHVFLEIGPHPVLLASIADCLDSIESDAVTVATSLRGSDEGMERASAIGELYARGVPVNWSRLAAKSARTIPLTYAWRHRSHWLAPLGARQTSDTAAAPPPSASAVEPETLRFVPTSKRELRELVTQQVAAVLRRAPEEIDRRAPLQDLGMDSMLTLRFTRALSAALGIRLSSTMVWAHPTIDALVEKLSTPEPGPPASADLSRAQKLDLIDAVLEGRAG